MTGKTRTQSSSRERKSVPYCCTHSAKAGPWVLLHIAVSVPPLFEIAIVPPGQVTETRASPALQERVHLRPGPQLSCLSARSPEGPAGPVAPVAPAGPGGPCSPLAPCGPALPWSPLAPCGPCGPGSPWLPLAPSAPGGPCSPRGPCGPGEPAGPSGPFEQAASENAATRAMIVIEMRMASPFAEKRPTSNDGVAVTVSRMTRRCPESASLPLPEKQTT
jgi:hypothetical protein